MVQDDSYVRPSGGGTRSEGGLWGGAVVNRYGGRNRRSIHAMRMIWKQHCQEKYWGFLLIDSHNKFNEENQIAMLWAVCFE